MVQAQLFGLNYPDKTCGEEVIDVLLYIERFLEANKNQKWASDSIPVVANITDEVLKTI